jgi:hypothetical protein
MHIFKNKTLRRILSVLLIAALIIGMDQALGQLLEPLTYTACFNHDIRELERSGTSADVIFIGASRTQRTFVPKVFEDEWGLNCVINAGSSAQPIGATYYLLKDLIERVHPDRVYIGVTIYILPKENEDGLQPRLNVFDCLTLKNKLLMALNCFSPKEMVYFFKSYRYNDQLSLEQIKTNRAEKAEFMETGNFVRADNLDRYADKGFVCNSNSFASGTISVKGKTSFSADNISPDKLKYLDACVELCKDNKIDIALVSGVTTVARMYYCESYQDADEYYHEYAEKNGIKYYNLNYMKDRETLLPDELMADYNHTNGEGAMVASKFFAEVIKKEENGEDISEYFYTNIDEFKKTVKRIVAVGVDAFPDEEQENLLHINITSLQNDDVHPKYRVLIREQSEEEYTVAQDWTSERELEIEIGDATWYFIKVEAVAEDPSIGTASHEYVYETGRNCILYDTSYLL